MNKPQETLTGWRSAVARRVFLKGLRVDASIGVYAHERLAPQPVVISLDLQVMPHRGDDRLVYTPPLTEGDRAARDIVCYDSLSKMVVSLATDGHTDYVETLAERIAERALEDDRIVEIAVTVEKPNAIEAATGAGVEIVRRR
ncbi:MAG: dihydroneopterin aldolase [Pseudomonadota bacterium]